MMNGNCRNSQTPNCRIGMFNPTNFITQSIGNFFQNTANMFCNPAQYSQNQNHRHFSTNTNRLNKTPGNINMPPYTTTFININDPMVFNSNQNHYNKYSNFNQQMDGMGHRLGHCFNKNNYKSDCDETVENSHFNQYRNRKFSKMNPRDGNRNWRDGHNKCGYKTSDKYKSTINENPEALTQGRNQRHHRNFNYSYSNKNNSNLIENKPSGSSNNNRSAEVVAIFTLEDFPELPVPKRHEPWSFTFPKSKSHITAKIMNNNNKKILPTKIESNTNNTYPELSKAKDKVSLKESDKHNFIEDNFVIIMDTNSPQFNKQHPNSTAGFTPFKPRQRQISECSDDSFIICFTNDAADGVIEFTDLSSSDDDIDDSDSDDDSDDDDDNNEHNNSHHMMTKSILSQNNKKTINNNINSTTNKKTENLKTLSNNLETLCVETASQPDSGFDDIKEKKVRFKLEPEVHVMHTWDYAYRAARKGEWESYARDRYRFKNRIDKVGPIISAILNDQHRKNMFKERFSNENSNV